MPDKGLVAAFSDRDTSSVVLRARGSGVFLFNPGISGRKLANAVLYYGSRRIEGAFISTLSRRDWSGLEELSGFMEIKRVFIPYGAQPSELSKILKLMAARGTVVERVWPGDRLYLAGLEVRPEWSGAQRGTCFDPGGYSGAGWRESLDWATKDRRFDIIVLDGGARVSIVRAAGGARILESRPGKIAETEL